MAVDNNSNNSHPCTSPEEAFTIATALTLLFANELNKNQMLTLVSILNLIEAGLSTIITQIDLCAGEDVPPPI